jgi:hypothetical protein
VLMPVRSRRRPPATDVERSRMNPITPRSVTHVE